MSSIIFDIEANGFKPTKIHCLSYWKSNKIVTLTDYEDMRQFLLYTKILVGHMLHRYDVRVLESLLGVKFKGRLIDTLLLSNTIFPLRKTGTFGLADFGVDYGVPKPPIDDWENLPLSEYVHRCEEDVKINVRLWEHIKKDLFTLYGDYKEVDRFIHYISFRADCAREQEEFPIKFDVVAAENLLSRLEALKLPKYDKLRALMPDIPVYAIKKMPAKMYTVKEELTKAGVDWFRFLRERGLSDAHTEEIKYIKSHKEPNPDSSGQVKDWLFSLEWEPETFESRKNSKGEFNEVPQLKNKDGDICPSIEKLFDKVPDLVELADYTNITTRIGTVKGLLKSQEDGRIKAQIGGLTNTLRYKHTKVVNLPKPSVFMGKEIRSLFICEDDEVMVGTDLASLEDRTKQHYIYPYDPEYVKTMSHPDYDPHTSFAVFAGALTEEQAQAHKDGTKDYTEVRHLYKTTNYMATYGVGAAKLSKLLKIPLHKGKQLLEGYWKLNNSIKSFAGDQVTKQCLGTTWVYNPVSKFWYHLRAKKDIFSTINQSTGVYIFDLFVTEVRKLGIKIRLSMHDEVMFTAKKSISHERIISDLKGCIKRVNERLCLNKEMDIDIKFGGNYSEVH